ncbi:crossover junction endonuclease EME1B isoform X2 [Eutrema salsugineum]|uniref:crossover junction endonuclease EME1B isoform X2 n=1 Tax=Eutrema salsugineum TaxID=72664 RepID=UPI000CECF82B|nr:crossover junction endonuclease EME1B isoform X2 [Eutrema salsugineum]
MKDHILISDGEDPVTPLPSLSKRARKDPISAILISDSDPTPQKPPPESSSTPLFVPDTPLSDDFSVVKCSFGPGAVASNREDKFSGKRVISLDSEFEDSPRPETSKKYGPMLADFREPSRGFESGFSVADFTEANYENAKITEGSIGKRIISLDSEFEDIPRPETLRKYEPVLIDFRDSRRVVESGFGDADSVEMNYENARMHERSIGKRVISLDSEFEDIPRPETSRKYEPMLADFTKPHRVLDSRSSDADSIEANTRINDNTNWMHEFSLRSSPTNDTIEVDSDQEKENISIEKMGNKKRIRSSKTTTLSGVGIPKKRPSKEDKIHEMEEKKLRKEQEKLQKAALKAEEAERKKLEKEKQKWEKGKLALKSIVAEIDTKVVEGSIGGLLLSRFSEKGITFRVAPNPIERSIVWTMTIPEDIAPAFPQGPKIPYVLLVYEAEEFCNLVANERLLENISRIQDQYPSYTVCCLTNKLMSYVKKREKEEYKNPGNWRRPHIDEVLAKLTTHYVRVHSRHCIDEAEVAEHVVGLTSSLASCQFRKKLTMLSVNANGALVSKDAVDKHLIKKSPWLKALVAIPKVQPRYAIAVWKKYPSMKSLLSVYMDPNKSVEGLVGGDIRLGEVCSKRIYRVLMSHNGAIKTDDVENGAAFFTRSPHLDAQ